MKSSTRAAAIVSAVGESGSDVMFGADAFQREPAGRQQHVHRRKLTSATDRITHADDSGTASADHYALARPLIAL